jgi:hypothetical protein
VYTQRSAKKQRGKATERRARRKIIFNLRRQQISAKASRLDSFLDKRFDEFFVAFRLLSAVTDSTPTLHFASLLRFRGAFYDITIQNFFFLMRGDMRRNWI